MARILSAALLCAAAFTQPVLADGLPPVEPDHPGLHRRVAPRPAAWRGVPIPRRQHRLARGALAIEASSYGSPPPPHAAAGPMLVEYREPYLGRGLLYNVPPPPTWGGGWAVSALN